MDTIRNGIIVISNKFLNFFFQKGIGYTINVKAVQETMKMFHVLQSNSFIEGEKMDDDCERGMFRAYSILTCLSQYKAISTGHSGKLNCVGVWNQLI